MPVAPALVSPDFRTTAYLAVETILRTHPTLRATGVVWLFPRDAGYDNALPASSLCCRVTPTLAAPDFGTACLAGDGRRHVLSPVEVTFHWRVPSWNWPDGANFWGHVERALKPHGLTERRGLDQQLHEAGVSHLEVVQAGAPLGPEDVAEARIRLDVFTVQ